MSRIVLNSVHLSYPVFGIHARSLKHKLVNMTIGGRLSVHDKSIIVKALSNIGFTLQGGDRLALIGPNGSGKSTLLRLLAGIYHPDQGTIKTEGSISSLLDASLGMDDEATGYENIKIRALLLNLPKSQLPPLVKYVEEFTELGNFLDMPIRTYSSGMRVRLAFAISTMIVPDILLVDEMIAAGDAAFQGKAKARTNEIIQNSQILVLATHNMEFAHAFCNKILRLEHGSIKAFGSIDLIPKEYFTKEPQPVLTE